MTNLDYSEYDFHMGIKFTPNWEILVKHYKTAKSNEWVYYIFKENSIADKGILRGGLEGVFEHCLSWIKARYHDPRRYEE